MALFSFFKTQKARHFEYKPMFYDKDKEKFNERVRQIEEEMGIHKDILYKSGIKRGSLRSYLKTEKKKNFNSSLRLIIILIILLSFFYFFLR